MTLPGKIILAPMAGFTEMPFRILCEKYGAEASLVPLVSATGIANNTEYLKRIRISEKENAGFQMFGTIPDHFYSSAKLIQDEMPSIKWIDLNCGCPSPRTTAGGAGSKMLKKPKLAAEIVSVLKKNDFLVSVKMRLLPEMEETLGFCKEIENAGVDFITVHGRTKAQGYSGKADWKSIKHIHENVGIPVVGNGDIQTVDEGKQKVKEDYADAFMIGRAALSNPKLFNGGTVGSLGEAKELLGEYLKICEENDFSEQNNIRLVSIQFFRGFRGSSELRNRLARAQNIEDIKVFIQ